MLPAEQKKCQTKLHIILEQGYNNKPEFNLFIGYNIHILKQPVHAVL